MFPNLCLIFFKSFLAIKITVKKTMLLYIIKINLNNRKSLNLLSFYQKTCRDKNEYG